MNRQEARQTNETLLNVYCGILFHARSFEPGGDVSCSYRFDCPEYEQLKKAYPIEKIAGKGGDFERALRLCRWLAPRLRHKGNFDNSVPCNALALMEYCFEKPDVGINCVNKAKILVECCLALGIYARRLWMFPASPYDMDNHVVTEIFDRKRRKWIILDPTSGGYFTDGTSPLSALEARELFAANGRVSVVMNRQNPGDVDALMSTLKNLEYNAYYAKNFFRLVVETTSGFGVEPHTLTCELLPEGFDGRQHELSCIGYRIATARRLGWDDAFIQQMERYRDKIAEDYAVSIGTIHMWDAPAG